MPDEQRPLPEAAAEHLRGPNEHRDWTLYRLIAADDHGATALNAMAEALKLEPHDPRRAQWLQVAEIHANLKLADSVEELKTLLRNIAVADWKQRRGSG